MIGCVDDDFGMRGMGEENQPVVRAAEFDLHAVGRQIEITLLRLEVNSIRADENFAGGPTVRKIRMERATLDASILLRGCFKIRHAAKLATRFAPGENEMGGAARE